MNVYIRYGNIRKSKPKLFHDVYSFSIVENDKNFKYNGEEYNYYSMLVSFDEDKQEVINDVVYAEVL